MDIERVENLPIRRWFWAFENDASGSRRFFSRHRVVATARFRPSIYNRPREVS